MNFKKITNFECTINDSVYSFEFVDKGFSTTIISFNHHNSCDIKNHGFHKMFLDELPTNTIYCKTSSNDWYQLLSLELFKYIINIFLDSSQSLIFYGSSMGGYAALFFSQSFCNSKVIALSPQYSFDINIMHNEKRWLQEWNIISAHNKMNKSKADRSIWVIYDDMNLGDKEHADMISSNIERVNLLRFPYAGHPAGYSLNRQGILKPLLSELFFSNSDLEVSKYTESWRANFLGDIEALNNFFVAISRNNVPLFIERLNSPKGLVFLENTKNQTPLDIGKALLSSGLIELANLFFNLSVRKCLNPHILAYVADAYEKQNKIEKAYALILKAIDILPEYSVFLEIKENIERKINSNTISDSKFHVACMQKNEGTLLYTWAFYWGQVAGFENILILDNGSDDEETIRVLRLLEICGVKIEKSYIGKKCFEKKGLCLLEALKDYFGDESRAILVDCDEFYYSFANDGLPSFNPKVVRESIIDDIKKLSQSQILRLDKGLLNIPNSTDAYEWKPKRVLIPLQFNSYIDEGLHLYHWGEGKDLCVRGYTFKTSSRLGIIHFHNCYFKDIVEKAKEKLKGRVTSFDREELLNYKGAGNHLIKYLLISEKEYLKGFENLNKINISSSWDSTNLEFPYM